MKAFAEQPQADSPKGKKVPQSPATKSSHWRGILDPDARIEAAEKAHEERQRVLHDLQEERRVAALKREAAEVRRKRAEQQNEEDQDRVREFLNSDPTHPDLEEYQKQIAKRNTDADRDPRTPLTELPQKKG